MRFLRNRFFIGILCIIAGLLFSFIAVPAIQGNGQESYINTVRAFEPIPAGTQITVDMLEAVSIPEKLIVGGIEDISSVVEKYARSDIYLGDFVTVEKITASIVEQDPLSAATLDNKQVVSITLPSLASCVSGKLLPGDIVTVMALPKSYMSQSLGLSPEENEAPENESGVIIYPELQYIEVCMMSASDGADAKVDSLPDIDEKNTLPVTISFYATPAQALRLVELEQHGIIHLAFVARGEAAAKYIPDHVISSDSNTEVN